MEEAAAAAAVSNGASVDVKPVISRGPSGDDAPNGIAGSSRVRGDLPMASAGESSKEVKIYGEWNTYISYRLAWGWVSLRAVFGAAEQTADSFPESASAMARATAHHHRRAQSSPRHLVTDLIIYSRVIFTLTPILLVLPL